MTAESLSFYADALVSLGEAAGQLERIEREFLDLLELLTSSRDLRNFLGDVTVTQKGKTAALEELLGGRVHAVLVHFILMVQAQGALSEITHIAEVFFAKASERRSKASGLLITSAPVPDDLHEHIEKEVGRILGKDVHLLAQHNPSLLGGLRVQVGSFVVDGTIDRQLDDMRRQLTA